MFFGLFNRKINKNAEPQPKIVSDYTLLTPKMQGIGGTAFACIDRIASEFAHLNYHIFNTKSKKLAERHQLLKLLRQPNLEDRHYNFFYQSAVDYFNGGCFWLKAQNVYKETVSLFRLNPKSVSITRDTNTNQRLFNYNGKTYTDDDIVYIPARYDYSTLYGGQSIFKAAQNTFDTAQSVETFTQSSFTNGVVGKRVVIDISKAFPDASDDQIKQIKDKWQKEYGGLENAGRPILKINGFEYDTLEGTSATNNQSAELFENRKLQEHEIAKIFGVPTELLSADLKNGNLENIFTLFAEFAVRPMATQFEEAISSLLDEDNYFFEFDYNGITKVSLQQRIDAYQKQFTNGILSINDIRAKENLEPVEAGDNHFVPVNLMPLNDETVNAYMAKQKMAIEQGQTFGQGDTIINPTDPNAQHSLAGDDHQ